MSAAVIEGSSSQSAQLDAAMAAVTMEGEPGHESDDDFQYEEVEVPR
jgi:hypothetical protein